MHGINSSCAVKHFLGDIPTILFPSLDVVFSVLILGGNLLVILVITKVPSLQNYDGYFIIQLSCADILVGLYLPINAASTIMRWVFVRSYLSDTVIMGPLFLRPFTFALVVKLVPSRL